MTQILTTYWDLPVTCLLWPSHRLHRVHQHHPTRQDYVQAHCQWLALRTLQKRFKNSSHLSVLTPWRVNGQKQHHTNNVRPLRSDGFRNQWLATQGWSNEFRLHVFCSVKWFIVPVFNWSKNASTFHYNHWHCGMQMQLQNGIRLLFLWQKNVTNPCSGLEPIEAWLQPKRKSDHLQFSTCGGCEKAMQPLKDEKIHWRDAEA